VPLRHPGRWVGTAVLLVLGAMLVHDITHQPRFGWESSEPTSSPRRSCKAWRDT